MTTSDNTDNDSPSNQRGGHSVPKERTDNRFLNKDIVVRIDGIHSPSEERKAELRKEIHSAWRDRNHSAISIHLGEYLKLPGDLTDDLVDIQRRLPALEHINALKTSLLNLTQLLDQRLFAQVISDVDRTEEFDWVYNDEDRQEIDALRRQLMQLREQAEDGWINKIEKHINQLCRGDNPNFNKACQALASIDLVSAPQEKKIEASLRLREVILPALKMAIDSAWKLQECDYAASLLVQHKQITGTLSPELTRIEMRLPAIRFVIAADQFISQINAQIERREFVQAIEDIRSGVPPPVDVQAEDRDEVRVSLGALKKLKLKVAAAWASDLEKQIQESCEGGEKDINQAETLLAGLGQVPLQKNKRRPLYDRLHQQIQSAKLSLFTKLMRAAHGRKDWDEAIRCGSMVLELEPEHRETAQILAQSRREKEIEEKKQEACRYLASGHFTECSVLCDELMKAEADTLKIDSNVFSGTVLELLQLAQAREKEFQACLADLGTEATGRNWSHINELINKALSLKPDNDEVVSIRRQVRIRRAARTARVVLSAVAACLIIAIGLAVTKSILDFRALVFAFDASIEERDYDNAILIARKRKLWLRHAPAEELLDAISAKDACSQAKKRTDDILFSDEQPEWQSAIENARRAAAFFGSNSFHQAGALWSRASAEFEKSAQFARVQISTEHRMPDTLFTIRNLQQTQHRTLKAAEGGYVRARVAPGEYAVSVSASDYSSAPDKLVATSGSYTNMIIALSPLPSRLRIESDTPARVLIDGKDVASTGEWIPNLYPGKRRVDIVAHGFCTYSVILTIVPNRSLTHKATLQKSGDVLATVRVPAKYGKPTSAPQTAQIKIGTNAWKKISLPYNYRGLAPGKHQLYLAVKGYKVSAKKAMIVGMKTTSLEFELTPKPATVTFTSNVSGSVQIFKGDQLLGNIGKPILLMPFLIHSLDFRAKGYRMSKLKVGPLKAGVVYTLPTKVKLTKQ